MSPSSCALLRSRLRARPEVTGERRRKQIFHWLPAAPASAASTVPGPKSPARGVESKLPVQQRPPPPPPPAGSWPGPKSPARGVESKLPVHLCPPPSLPPGQARCRRRGA